MSELSDVITSRIISAHSRVKDATGMPRLINFQVDVVCAFNNVPSSKDYDPQIPVDNGALFRINYLTAKDKRETVFFETKHLAENFIAQLRDPDSQIYKDAA